MDMIRWPTCSMPSMQVCSRRSNSVATTAEWPKPMHVSINHIAVGLVHKPLNVEASRVQQTPQCPQINVEYFTLFDSAVSFLVQR